MSRVLMLDDAGLFQMLETSFLRRLGCEIVRVADGRQMIERARASVPDLILLDAQWPGIDGPGCLRALKADPALRSIPVLVVTSRDDVARVCDAGADVALARPLSDGALELALCSLGRVSHRLGRRRPARIPARVASPAGDLRARVKDISRTGLFLALSPPLPINASLRLSLRLPGPEGVRSIEARGVVVRQVPPDPESHLIPGVGVRFVEIDAASESVIDHYVGEEP
jgi:two-component system cell cycle response regulator DivK